MGKVIAITNMKGGVGKTTLTLNLGAGLVEAGQRVLLIDLDPQASLSLSFGVDIRDKQEIHIGTWLLKNCTFEQCMMSFEEQPLMHFIPSNLTMNETQKQIDAKSNSDRLLRNLFKPYRNQFDYVLMDCPPNLGVMTANAFNCADEFIIPLLPQFYSYDGVEQILNFSNEIKTENEELTLGGLVFNQYNPLAKGNAKHDIVRAVRNDKNVGHYVFQTVIRINDKLSTSPQKSKTIFELDPHSNGAIDFRNLTKEILQRHGKSN